MLSTKWIVSFISISRLRFCSCGGLVVQLPIQRLSLVGQLGFLDSGNVDMVAVEESHQFSYFAADSVRVP